ncbi:MAG TPA: hypothetical protein VF503_20415 [Sphingobium sp.]|uniref:hypothetical protein n=1 Tax=Sphingobium sp. TaxID=1912891 RepID=UPI002ED36E94
MQKIWSPEEDGYSTDTERDTPRFAGLDADEVVGPDRILIGRCIEAASHAVGLYFEDDLSPDTADAMKRLRDLIRKLDGTGQSAP